MEVGQPDMRLTGPDIFNYVSSFYSLFLLLGFAWHAGFSGCLFWYAGQDVKRKSSSLVYVYVAALFVVFGIVMYAAYPLVEPETLAKGSWGGSFSANQLTGNQIRLLNVFTYWVYVIVVTSFVFLCNIFYRWKPGGLILDGRIKAALMLSGLLFVSSFLLAVNLSFELLQRISWFIASII
jgi:hypothetical protein